MILRRATMSDALAIAGLHTASWRAFYRDALSPAYLDSDIIADRETLWTARLSIERDEQMVLLAESDEGLLGFSCAFLGADPIWGALLDNLHVCVRHQRSGIGKALLAATRSWLRQQGTDVMHLWVLRDNTRARAFYEAQGGAMVEESEWNPPDGGPPVPTVRMSWGRAGAMLATTSPEQE